MFKGLNDLDNIDSLIENAKKMVGRIDVPQNVLNYLYSNARVSVPLQEQWERDVKLAIGTDEILREYFRPTPLNEYSSLIDRSITNEAIRELTFPQGVLVMAFHGGFPALVRRLFDEGFKDGFMIRRENAISDTGGSLFGGLRSLIDGKNVYLAADGWFGKQATTINVLDFEYPVTDGAAFLAFESRSLTAWLSFSFDGEVFIPVVRPGPQRNGGETFVEFRGRLYSFYAKQIEEALTGAPISLPLSRRWKLYMRDNLH